MLKLYHGITSVCSIKVRIGLAEIGLDYESEVLDLQIGDQFDPDYIKLNPAAVVPTLIDDGLVLVESSLILEYLDRIHNKSQLMPNDRVRGAEARHWLLRCLAIHAAINTLTFSTVMRQRQLAVKSLEEIEASLTRMPDPMARLKRIDLLKHGLGSSYVTQALTQLRGVLSDMSSALARSEWISGAEFGIADVALVSYIDRLERLGFEGLWLEKHPQVSQWLTAMQTRSSYQMEVMEKIPGPMAAQMRANGAEHWKELAEIWSKV